MTPGPTPRLKAIGLISGGLDSTLAAAILMEMGVDVVGLNFSTGFCKVDHRRAINDPREQPERLRNPALQAGALLGFPVRILDVAEEYLEVVKNPRFGFGSNVNPCIDCRIFMLVRARQIMEEEGADLVFTGEVVGQRPMSQYKRAMRRIEEQSGLDGRLLRPLSAGFLEPTLPEQDGRLDRSGLLSIQGRSRRMQIDLAARLGIDQYAQPSGGCCYLADPNYARRFRDWVAHTPPAALRCEDTTLLKVGRHFRISPTLKLITARNEGENRFLERFISGRWSFCTPEKDSTLALCIGEPDGREQRVVASIVARYSRRREQEQVEVRATRGDETRLLSVRPAEDTLLERFRLG